MDRTTPQPVAACACPESGVAAGRTPERRRQVPGSGTGLVPVCSWCRKVRDEAGAWAPAEPGLLESARQTLTHGVCPACAREVILRRRQAA